ncbi:hypothetical protein ANCCEY_03997 [Ancylostoma ceylanicum]|uniref:Nucleotide-diphospho-sugar transferase domain-containing protein n=1 Tax=Ancylostoma ceylanicum TaxID=53326 RepID=A0A0D6M3G5_9BILA|nr:hypothetical protein ANCCEY_03997 [Ancylostoma ceylanicum]
MFIVIGAFLHIGFDSPEVEIPQYSLVSLQNLSVERDRYVVGGILSDHKIVTNAKIAIVTVLRKMADRDNYTTAMTSMECYSKRYNYKYIVVDSDMYKNVCKQELVVFQRHCIVATLLSIRDIDWILMIDADIGVVNEKRRIEEFIDWDKDIIFYERFFNFEVTAGTYLAKNSEAARIFLQGWAEYEDKLPASFHGKDQGALHAWLMQTLAPESKLYDKCLDFWIRSKNYDDLNALKGKGWCRDAWLTNSHWNPEIDFMFHAWKEVYKLTYKKEDIGKLSGGEFYPWFETLKVSLKRSQCPKADVDWIHDKNLIAPVSDLQAHLNRRLQNVEHSYNLLKSKLNL